MFEYDDDCESRLISRQLMLMEWNNNFAYKFNGIRHNCQYHFLLLLLRSIMKLFVCCSRRCRQRRGGQMVFIPIYPAQLRADDDNFLFHYNH